MSIVGLKVKVSEKYPLKFLLPEENYAICAATSGHIHKSVNKIKSTVPSVEIKTSQGTHCFYDNDIAEYLTIV